MVLRAETDQTSQIPITIPTSPEENTSSGSQHPIVVVPPTASSRRGSLEINVIRNSTNTEQRTNSVANENLPIISDSNSSLDELNITQGLHNNSTRQLAIRFVATDQTEVSFTRAEPPVDTGPPNPDTFAKVNKDQSIQENLYDVIEQLLTEHGNAEILDISASFKEENSNSINFKTFTPYTKYPDYKQCMAECTFIIKAKIAGKEVEIPLKRDVYTNQSATTDPGALERAAETVYNFTEGAIGLVKEKYNQQRLEDGNPLSGKNELSNDFKIDRAAIDAPKFKKVFEEAMQSTKLSFSIGVKSNSLDNRVKANSLSLVKNKELMKLSQRLKTNGERLSNQQDSYLNYDWSRKQTFKLDGKPVARREEFRTKENKNDLLVKEELEEIKERILDNEEKFDTASKLLIQKSDIKWMQKIINRKPKASSLLKHIIQKQNSPEKEIELQHLKNAFVKLVDIQDENIATLKFLKDQKRLIEEQIKEFKAGSLDGALDSTTIKDYTKLLSNVDKEIKSLDKQIKKQDKSIEFVGKLSIDAEVKKIARENSEVLSRVKYLNGEEARRTIADRNSNTTGPDTTTSVHSDDSTDLESDVSTIGIEFEAVDTDADDTRTNYDDSDDIDLLAQEEI